MNLDCYTPLPKELKPNNSHHEWLHVPIVIFFGLVIVVVTLIGGWYLYNNIGLLSSLTMQQNTPPLPSPKQQPTPTLTVEQGGVGEDWVRQYNQICNITLFIPPAEEPYLIPRDPNTIPTATDDEGKFWIYEESPQSLFMFDHMVRVIFKNPETLGSGYVSAAVEVLCAPNDQGYSTESLFVKIQNDLLQNFSVISLVSSGEEEVWGRTVKTAVFAGGSFGNETYYLFATDEYIYMIRPIGESNNSLVQQVRDAIFLNVRFE